MKTKNHPIPTVRSGKNFGVGLNSRIALRRFTLGLGAFIFIAACELSPSPAQADPTPTKEQNSFRGYGHVFDPPATPAPKKRIFSGGPGNPALSSEKLQPRTHTGKAGIRTFPTDIIAPENGESAKTLLVWDSGDDHPFATVWLKIDDEEEKMFQPLGQGKRQILVKPGKVYLYIIKDSGERLATATVRARASIR